MQLTESQYNFCKLHLGVLLGSIRGPLHDKPRMNFSLRGSIVLCELSIGDFVIDSFYPEIYIP